MKTPKKLEILPVLPINNHFPFHFYDMYYEHQKEFRDLEYVDKNEPIETEEQCIEFFRNCEDSYVNNIIYVDKNPIGFISFQLIDWLDDGKPAMLYIDHLYIKKQYRQLGFGTLTITSILKELKSQGAEDTHIFFYILKKNKGAHEFWDKIMEKLKLRHIEDDRCKVGQEEEFLKEGDKYIIKRIIL